MKRLSGSNQHATQVENLVPSLVRQVDTNSFPQYLQV